ncbi:OmpA family protein [Chitinophagales bacterium]|nr:OmpA family protein [Chitinophagales bacterium]
MKKWIFLWSLAVFTAVMGQENQYEVAVIGFYNLENLFDTDSSMQTINVDKLNAGEVDYVLSETFDVDKYYSSDWVSLYENVSISKSRTDYSKLPEVPVEALRFTKPNKKDYEERTNKKLSQKEFDAMIASDDKWLSKKEFQELIKNNETITVNSKEVVAKVNDFDNTPLGSRQYTAELYQDKLNKLAEVIASLGDGYSADGAALVGLAEIENEKVLKDLAATDLLAERNYAIIQYDCMYSRGVDVALYYQPKYFKVIESRAIQVPIFNDKNETDRYYTRDILWVEGNLLGEKVHVFVNHWPSRRGGEAKSSKNREKGAEAIKEVIDELMAQDPNTAVIVMGDFNDDPTNKSVKDILGAAKKKEDVKQGGMFNPLYEDYKKGYGSLAYRGSWNLFDQILLSSSLVNEEESWHLHDAEVAYNQDWINRFGGYEGGPNRSFGGNYYQGGYSDHLPSVVYFKRPAVEDRDKDGVPDKNDACPDVPGFKNMKGCPDTDGDGIEDPRDSCIDEPGPADNKGCPYLDSDNDGVYDKDDECPQTQGLKANKGCPELDEEIKATVQRAFENLLFETNKSIIQKSSDDELEALAQVMKDNPELLVKISGYTDNEADEAFNLELSKNRAFAVKDRLVSLGVEEERITALYFGETQPVADNDTAEGRKENRRVEIELKAK